MISNDPIINIEIAFQKKELYKFHLVDNELKERTGVDYFIAGVKHIFHLIAGDVDNEEIQCMRKLFNDLKTGLANEAVQSFLPKLPEVDADLDAYTLKTSQNILDEVFAQNFSSQGQLVKWGTIDNSYKEIASSKLAEAPELFKNKHWLAIPSITALHKLKETLEKQKPVNDEEFALFKNCIEVYPLIRETERTAAQNPDIKKFINQEEFDSIKEIIDFVDKSMRDIRGDFKNKYPDVTYKNPATDEQKEFAEKLVKKKISPFRLESKDVKSHYDNIIKSVMYGSGTFFLMSKLFGKEFDPTSKLYEDVRIARNEFQKKSENRVELDEGQLIPTQEQHDIAQEKANQIISENVVEYDKQPEVIVKIMKVLLCSDDNIQYFKLDSELVNPKMYETEDDIYDYEFKSENADEGDIDDSFDI